MEGGVCIETSCLSHTLGGEGGIIWRAPGFRCPAPNPRIPVRISGKSGRLLFRSGKAAKRAAITSHIILKRIHTIPHIIICGIYRMQ